MFRKLEEEYDRWGLNINLTKTEYLKVGEEQTEDSELHIHEIKRCSEYKYLGSIISEEGNSKKDIHSRVQQGKKVIRLLNHLLWSNKTSIQTKIRIYKAIVEPILTYGAECCQFTAKERRMVESVEMDFLRRVCRISRMAHIRNEEIRQRTRRIYTSTDNIESRQLLWYGHVKRMGGERWPKREMEYRPQSRRKRGRPTTTWLDGVDQYMRDRAINQEEWQNRTIWRSKCGMRQKL
ncbi:uncharacterized protein LOC115889851 [Sitophilus oryzae]|uniref:Uncharacterized protein LOC115889851 n=1 Tax=Sitophilus oryzae TaxID=7048 RepID=A0A6J2YR49_SITOR|nr:uncharacterized protein LOC115889851 [Sitophilus oryzae]